MEEGLQAQVSQMPATTKIAAAMSGGVDSSVAAAMLRSDGHDVVGLTMQLWNQRRLAGRPGMPEHVEGRCCSLDDVYDARRIAEQLGIPYYVVNHQERFERDVVRPFVQEYLSGRTPVPCTLCNNHLKFDQLLLTAEQIGAERVATGHYARVEFDQPTNRWRLLRGVDPARDQSYFLFGLTQEQLSRTLFPLGHMHKPEVRELARKLGLAAAISEKPDSQEICFVPAGEHAGIHNFTVGQRKGIGVAPKTRGASPLYVLGIHGSSRQVVVGSGDDLYSRELRALNINLISVADLREPLRVTAKIRHRHEPAAALAEQIASDELRLTFDEPQRAITPGQAVVLYQDDVVVGGGWIS